MKFIDKDIAKCFAKKLTEGFTPKKAATFAADTYKVSLEDVLESVKDNWIEKATDNSHGQFAADAKRHGMTTKEFADKEKHAKGKLGKEARLADTLMDMHEDMSNCRPTTSTKHPVSGYGFNINDKVKLSNNLQDTTMRGKTGKFVSIDVEGRGEKQVIVKMDNGEEIYISPKMIQKT